MESPNSWEEVLCTLMAEGALHQSVSLGASERMRARASAGRAIRAPRHQLESTPQAALFVMHSSSSLLAQIAGCLDLHWMIKEGMTGISIWLRGLGQPGAGSTCSTAPAAYQKAPLMP